MTHATAGKLTDLALVAAVAGGAYYVLRTPSRRRLAWRLAVAGLTGTVPAWFRQEIAQAWHESGRSTASHPTASRSRIDPPVAVRGY